MIAIQLQLAPLLVVSVHGEGHLFRLDQDTHQIGRSHDASIQLSHPQISRQHTLLVRQPDGRYLLCDGDGHTRPSKNGTYVNGIPVERRYLHSGDVIALGSPEIVAQYFQPEPDSQMETV